MSKKENGIKHVLYARATDEAWVQDSNRLITNRHRRFISSSMFGAYYHKYDPATNASQLSKLVETIRNCLLGHVH